MEDKELYKLSKTLKDIRNQTVVLNKSDWYAYHNLVDSSERGFNCGYAKRLKIMGYEEKEFNKFITALTEMENSIKTIRKILNENKEKKV
jgi:GTPase involved in cell partitioning and DNA repair